VTTRARLCGLLGFLFAHPSFRYARMGRRNELNAASRQVLQFAVMMLRK
jgi:hypothetical protein